MSEAKACGCSGVIDVRGALRVAATPGANACRDAGKPVVGAGAGMISSTNLACDCLTTLLGSPNPLAIHVPVAISSGSSPANLP